MWQDKKGGGGGEGGEGDERAEGMSSNYVVQSGPNVRVPCIEYQWPRYFGTVLDNATPELPILVGSSRLSVRLVVWAAWLRLLGSCSRGVLHEGIRKCHSRPRIHL